MQFLDPRNFVVYSGKRVVFNGAISFLKNVAPMAVKLLEKREVDDATIVLLPSDEALSAILEHNGIKFEDLLNSDVGREIADIHCLQELANADEPKKLAAGQSWIAGMTDSAFNWNGGIYVQSFVQDGKTQLVLLGPNDDDNDPENSGVLVSRDVSLVPGKETLLGQSAYIIDGLLSSDDITQRVLKLAK